MNMTDIQQAVQALKANGATEEPRTFIAAPWLVEMAKQKGMTPQEYVDCVLETTDE